MAPGGSRCVLKLCPYFKGGRKTDKNLRLHAFPKDPQVRKIWEDWVVEKHVAGNTKFGVKRGLCSAHFSKESYRPGSVRLKENAVPSIAPEWTADLAFQLGLIPTVEVFDEFLANIGSWNTWSPCVGSTSPSAVGVAVQDRVGEMVREEVVPEEMPDTLMTDDLCRVGSDEGCKAERYPEEMADPLMTDDLCRVGSNEEDKAQSVVSPVPRKKKKRLAYVGDITPADFESPERAERSLAVMKSHFADMTGEIRNLRRALSRAKKKLNHYKFLLLSKKMWIVHPDKSNLSTGKKIIVCAEAKSLAVKQAKLRGQKQAKVRVAV